MSTPTEQPHTTCARCGGTGTVEGHAGYPGTYAYRPPEPCPVCHPRPTSERQHRQLDQRSHLTRLLADALARGGGYLPSPYPDCGLVTYEHDGHSYTASITVTQTA